MWTTIEVEAFAAPAHTTGLEGRLPARRQPPTLRRRLDRIRGAGAATTCPR